MRFQERNHHAQEAQAYPHARKLPPGGPGLMAEKTAAELQEYLKTRVAIDPETGCWKWHAQDAT